jgi:EAL domain-containing protein (putative c-di-GMP-specific phosphodiesterase class I)/GGDEF domain-containing protein
MENDTNSSDTLKSEVNELKKEIDIYKQRVNELIEEIEEHKHYLTINPKTGLPNHKVFVKDLQKLMEERNTGSSQLFAIIFIDLNKSLTKIEYSLDSYLSDAILSRTSIEVKEVLENSFNASVSTSEKYTLMYNAPLEGVKYNIYHSERNEDLIVLIPHIDNKDFCIEIVKMIYKKITTPKQLEFNKDILQLFCYMAVAFYPINGTMKEELLSNVETALRYAVERDQPIVIYSNELGRVTRYRKLLETELRNAVEGKSFGKTGTRFELWFQPFVDRTFRIVGAESLIRWNHPSKGIIMPLHFISLAEKNGLIVPLGFIVIEEASRNLKRWIDSEYVKDEFYLTVNLSPKQFRQQYLGQRIEKILNDFSIPPGRFQIEITEVAYFDNPQNAATQIRELAKKGINLILDDCGAAGNAIYNLSKLPEDIIKAKMIKTAKIDRSLVNNIKRREDRLIFKHSIEMAWYFGFNVIVEGVENEEQNKIIEEIENELSASEQEIRIIRQGYYFAKPLPESEFLELLKKGYVEPHSVND